MNPTHLSTLSGKRGTPIYFYYAGNEAFGDPENILRYILPAALVFLTFVAIPPLLLLDYLQGLQANHLGPSLRDI
jgi:hypothetical protein